MFSFEHLHTIQIEITNRCQASCPMCLRNIHGGIENPSLSLTDWSIEQFRSIFNDEVLKQVKHINFCGDFGDPIMNSDLIEMCQHLKDAGNIGVSINTNGSARTNTWWGDLARALPKDHRVEFALDGLRTTHSLYRIGTDFNTIIGNAGAFMSAGGNAHWMYIKFKHNEHEVEVARNIANDLGFSSFTVKNSKRFGKKFPVLDRSGAVTHYIEQPANSDIQSVEFIDLKDYKEWKTDISCFAVDSKELYIDANGYLMPCCIIGSFLYANYDVELYRKYGVIDETSITGIAREVQLEVFSIIQELGGLDALDSNKHSIKEIMSTDVWQKLIHYKWNDNSASTCKILCGNNGPFIKIEEQINRTS